MDSSALRNNRHQSGDLPSEATPLLGSKNSKRHSKVHQESTAAISETVPTLNQSTLLASEIEPSEEEAPESQDDEPGKSSPVCMLPPALPEADDEPEPDHEPERRQKTYRMLTESEWKTIA